MTDNPAPKPARDAKGGWLPGHSGNPGGRVKLPEWFKQKGPGFLEKISAIAETDGHEHHFKALVWCTERIYGKAPPEQKDDGEERQMQALVAFIETMKAKPKEGT